MHRLNIALVLVSLLATAQSTELFGFPLRTEALPREVANYVSKTIWVRGKVSLSCQETGLSSAERIFFTSPAQSFLIQNIYLVDIPKDFYPAIAFNGGTAHPMDRSALKLDSAFLVLLESATPLKPAGLINSSDIPIDDPRYLCQTFYSLIVPEAVYLQRAFSFTSPQEAARKHGWTSEQLATVLEARTSHITEGLTREMVLWLRGWPLDPLELSEALIADTWIYRGVVPLSLTLHFENDKVASFEEGKLP